MKKFLATTLILAGIGGCGYLAHANNLKQETIDEQATKIEQLEEENSSRANEITSLKNTVATLQDEKADLEEEKLSLISSRTEKIQEINSLKAEISELEKENNELKTGEKIIELQQRILELEAVERSQTVELEELNRELEQKNQTISFYEQYISDLEREEVIAKFFDSNGNVLAIQEYKTGDTLQTLPEFTDNDDFTETTFNFWYEENNPEVPINANYVVNGNVNVYPNVSRSYYVNFEIDGTCETENSQIVSENGYIDISKVPTATKENHTFKGWSDDFGLTIIEDLSTYKITKYTDLTAVFEINKYDLNFKVNDEIVASSEISYGCSIGNVIPTPEVPTGMRFLGWQLENPYGYTDLYTPDPSWTIGADTTYIAVFEHLLAGLFKTADGSVTLEIAYANDQLYVRSGNYGTDSTDLVDFNNGIIQDGTENSYNKLTYNAETDTWTCVYHVVSNGQVSTGTPKELVRTAHSKGVKTW